MGGSAFAFSDSSGMAAPLGKATASVEMTALCGCGTDDTQNPPSYTFYGGGLGINLNMTMGSSTMGAVAQSGTGVTYAVTSIPTNGLRVQVIDSGGTTYCNDVAATATSGTIPWAMFTTTCYDASPGTALPASDMLTQLEFLVPSTTTAGSWDFCITALSF
jgi:hypothetical protein